MGVGGWVRVPVRGLPSLPVTQPPKKEREELRWARHELVMSQDRLRLLEERVAEAREREREREEERRRGMVAAEVRVFVRCMCGGGPVVVSLTF